MNQVLKLKIMKKIKKTLKFCVKDWDTKLLAMTAYGSYELFDNV